MREPRTPNLSPTPGEHARRDAVHVAVAPVVAAAHLLPGQHVGVLADGRAGADEEPIGVVDPFLTEAVRPGQRFWLLLYPGTITSLRHVWTHPAFTVKVPAKLKATHERRTGQEIV
jgi:hypothetical protein